MAEQGNVDAMRDALRQISQALWKEIDPGCNDDCCAPKRELARLADAALAKLPRNCDRFKNATEAGIAYRNYLWARAGRVVDIDENTFFANLVNWLFAPAE